MLAPNRQCKLATASYHASETVTRLFDRFFLGSRRTPVRRNPLAETAVVLHLHYPERWDPIRLRLGYLEPTRYDLFVTVSGQGLSCAGPIRSFKADSDIRLVQNRGRDILPFLCLLPALSAAGYSNVLKVHSKRTVYRADGDDWFDALLGSLLPGPRAVRQVLDYLAHNNALIGPKDHFVSLQQYMGSNALHLEKLLSQLYGPGPARTIVAHAGEYGYFAGSMFWASLSSLRPLARLRVPRRDFREGGQRDGTVAHAVERIFTISAQLTGSELLGLSDQGLVKMTPSEIIYQYQYAN